MDVGEVIKDYQVVEHIGRGGMADVWSARDGKLNRMVAVKTIAHGLSPDSDPVGMFKREAQTIASLEHPHILPIYDFGEHQGSLYIVMRYVSGGSLAGWMERGQLSLEEGLRVLTAMAQALDYAHARNVIHLDLKPQNILLDSHKQPYLADFGLATALDPHGRAANPGSGTLLYMAPEQLTSESLDKRADIYSFAIMAFHILNGKLPFDGMSPLVMKQLQFQQDLPDIPSMPPAVSDILRRSAALDPGTRHETTSEMVDALRSALAVTLPLTLSTTTEFLPGVAPELQEAAAIYQRARAAWDGGQGRFILGVTDFMVMEAAYNAAESNGLELDDYGRQMLLRGALEYGIDLEAWWERLDDSHRRWVSLHAVRSANAPARVRAMRSLEALPDEEPPRIPRLIAQALQVETDDEVKIAALHLLAARALHRVGATPMMPELTQTMTRVLLTLARVEQRELPPDEWLPTAFGPEVDLLIAEMALDPTQPSVSEAAARAVASIRSEAAVKYIADQQRSGRKGALRALALVRDQAPNLPDVVSRLGRFYAWTANSFRRMTAHPLSLIWRFLFAVIGGALARGWQLWTTYDLPVNVLEPNRVANTIAYGLVFGVFVGVLVLLADEIPSRLRGFWKWPLRAGVAFTLGIAWGALTWGVEHYMYLQLTDINRELMLFGGFGLALGFAFNSLLHLRAWTAVLLTGVAVYLPIYAAWNNYCSLGSYCVDSPPFSIAPVAGVGLLIGLFCGVILRVQTGRSRLTMPWSLSPRAQGVAAVILSGFWAVFALLAYTLGTTQPPLTWLGVLGFALFGMLPGLLAGYTFNGIGRVGFGLTAALAFFGLLPQITPILQSQGPFPLAEPLFYVRFNFLTGTFENNQLFYATIPFAVLLALGGHAQLIAREIREVANARRLRRQSAEAVVSGGLTQFLNRPKAALPDTATLMDAVREAREELSRTGVLEANTARVATADIMDANTAAVPLVDQEASTAPIESETQAEIRRAQESDQ